MKKLFFNQLRLVASALFLFCTCVALAQVTIGSSAQPVDGALLQLKSNNNPDVNANGGLLLPRVNLTDMKQLYPMFEDDVDYTSNTGGKKDALDAEHAGLVVYNVNVDICADINAGVHIWDSKKWIALSSRDDAFPSETDILEDKRDPVKTERYQIGKFGDAGWWMLENLRAEKWPDGTTAGDISMFREPPKTRPRVTPEYPPTYSSRYYEGLYWYPKNDKYLLASNPEYGYVYSGYAALRTTFEDILSGKETTNTQGVCPDGWYLPSKQDWEELMVAISNNVCQYAHSTEGLDTGYNIASKGEFAEARSRSKEQGGLDVHLLGVVGNSGTVNPNPDYDHLEGEVEYIPRLLNPEMGMFWFSDTTTDNLTPDPGQAIENIWGTMGGTTAPKDGVADTNKHKIGRASYTLMLPVRCKKR